MIQQRQRVAAQDAAFNNAVKEIRDQKASVEGAIVYKNDEVAYSEFKTANEKLASLICKTAQQKTTCASLKDELGALGIKLRKITVAKLTNLTNFEALPKTGKEGLVKAKNKLIAFSPATSSLFVYDLLSGETKIISTYPSITGFTEASTPKENDYILFVYNKKQLMRLNMNDLSVNLIEISFTSDKSEIAGFSVYNRRLYVLDPADNTILRHDSIKTGFSPGQDWLKDKSSSLSDGYDLTIDGDVFITKNDGKILKFASGEVQGFQVFGIDPAINSPAKIWTYTDIPYIYVLETSQKRLIVFEKDGHFVGQYTNDSLVQPTGFSVDYASRTAYILDSGKLMKLPIQ